jgi:hypothetical protein
MGMNFRNGYEFDPETYGAAGAGGLPGLLRQVMLQQGTPSQAGPALAQDPGGYGNPGGLLGRLLALQAEQPEMHGDNVGQRSSPLPSSAVRQLSARVATPPPGASRPASRSEDQSYPPYPRFGEGPLPGASSALSQGAGSFEAGGTPSAPIRIAGASVNMTPFGWRRGMPMPVRPNELGDVPQIPMPHIPDWLSTAWGLSTLLPTLALESVRARGDRIDCDKRYSEETAKCWKRKEDYAHPDHLYGCLERAKDRWTACLRNKGNPSRPEPPEWGPADEEIWINPDR